MKYKSIDARMTEIVAGFIQNGWLLSTNSFSGHQGEVAKVDLTNGTDVVRIVLDSFSQFSGGDADNITEYYISGYQITIGYGNKLDCFHPHDPSWHSPMWTVHLQNAVSERFYCLGETYRGVDWFTTNKEEAIRAYRLRSKRYASKGSSPHHELPDAARKVALRILRRRKGMKSLPLNMVGSVCVTDAKGISGFYAVVGGKRISLSQCM